MLTASSDLVTIARSQIALLTQSLGAGASAVYLTEETSDGMPPNLIQVVAYPDDNVPTLPPETFPMLPTSEKGDLVRQRRMVLPLIYQEAILGFLMTGRDDRDWTEPEQTQIQQVANTLAVACALDRRCQWLEENQRRVYEQQNHFLSSLLHQLRNPLTAIRTFSQLLLRRIMPEDPNHKFVSGILREARHIQDLLAEAEHPTPLLLAQSKTGLALLPAAELEILPTDLREILDAISTAASAIAQERNLHFMAVFPEYIPLVLANAAALREVLGNLVDNALKYTPEEGCVGLSVSVLDGGYVSVIVQDTGVGIPASDMTHLFERSFRGRQADGNISGTGLGLAIANDLIKKMHGNIQVSSQPDLGSIFTVNLKMNLES
ncbi:ATP-binding protein [Tumidithrix elongata RA019]|uniref:histidine kinase n=1 Tax=Tumidithrix elongata BACA0141 TaxID=2716417 RepID=A0AAW9PRR7_9CYAN|nr:ATP-binding protein [Tumidithrix elongata RA019]